MLIAKGILCLTFNPGTWRSRNPNSPGAGYCPGPGRDASSIIFHTLLAFGIIGPLLFYILEHTYVPSALISVLGLYYPGPGLFKAI